MEDQDQLEYMLESFKQELTDIYTTNSNAVISASCAWQGEASAEYINTLQQLGEHVLGIIQRVEHLQEKANVFTSLLSDADTSI